MSATQVAVTFVVDQMAPGGAERHALALANGLDRNRFRVSFVVLKPGGSLETLVDRRQLVEHASVDVASKLDLDAARRLAAHLDRTGAQVVLATNPYATLYAVLGARQAARRTAVVSTFHSTDLPGLKNQLQMMFYRLVFPRCDALVYVCDYQRQFWRRRGLRARRDLRIYNGIDMAHFAAAAAMPGEAQARAQLGLGQDDYVVGICAALRPEKSHSDLLDAVALLASRLPALRCLVIGDGPERSALERRIESLGLVGKVRITGFQLDVRPCIGACDVMVLSSSSETFSLSALESMALGKPMVMTRTGGAAEQVEPGETGYLYPPGDVASLAAHLERLAAPAERVRMGRQAAKRVRERFPLEQMLEEYSALLERESGTSPRDVAALRVGSATS